MLIIFALPKTNTREHNYTATYPHVDRPVTALCSGSSLTRTVRGRNELQRHLHSIMYKTAAITACLAGVVAGLQLPTRRQFGIGVGTAAVVPPALAAGGKVVVVGGAGFVGTEISHLLATQGVKVVSVSRRSAAAQAQKVQYEQFVDFVSLDASKDDLSSVSVWKSNFGRRTPSARCCLRSRNLTHWLISTQFSLQGRERGDLLRRRGAGAKEPIGREWSGE